MGVRSHLERMRQLILFAVLQWGGASMEAGT